MSWDPTTAAMRFGYGLPVPGAAPGGIAAMLGLLGGPDLMAARWPIGGMAEVLPVFAAIKGSFNAMQADPSAEAAYTEARQAAAGRERQAQLATLARAIDAPDGLRERLVAFWADHFTAVARSPAGRLFPYALVEDAIRPNLSGSFAAMLTAVTLHPAMLIYLDQIDSFGPDSPAGRAQQHGLNENLARELIELHTLGAEAAYDQDTVRQLAELLTGLAFNAKRGAWFAANRAEPGPEIVLGQSYQGEGLAPIMAVLDDLARRPETAAHLARKLAVHFVADNPDPGLVAAIESAWKLGDGNLDQVYAALLNHPAAWAGPAQKARQPFDFMAASLRALAITGLDLAALGIKQRNRLVFGAMRAMGQPLKSPRGPDGWAEAAADWISPQGLAARISWAMDAPGRLVRPLPEPAEFARRALGDRASARLLWAAERAEDRREGVGLVLASPEFNRR